MKIKMLLDTEQEPREFEEADFDFEEYKSIMMGTKTDQYGNSLNDVFIGKRSYKKTSIKWLEVVD
ncbi:MAG: hypothetical protein ACLTXM_09225 [Enterococcus sp.]